MRAPKQQSKVVQKIKAESKECVRCGTSFSRRKPSGGLLVMSRWDAKKTCTNKCHIAYSWSHRKESIEDRFWRQVAKGDTVECWEWQGASRDRRGYGGFYLSAGKMERAHRVAYRLGVGEIPTALVVRHKCDNPTCCNPGHLELGTVADNNADRDRRGRHVTFARDKNPRTKVKEQELAKLLDEYASLPRYDSGMCKRGQATSLASKYGISLEWLCTLAKKGK